MKNRFCLIILCIIIGFIFATPSKTAAQNVANTKFGMFYLIWHCPVVNNLSRIPDVTEILAGHGSWAPIPNFHYWGKPSLGYYCLSQNEDVLRQHAIALRDLGIDFVFVDSTNQNYTDSRSPLPQEMIMTPFIKLLQVWGQIPGAPKVVPWVPVVGDGNMVTWLLDELNKYPALKFYFQGKPLLLTGFAPPTPPGTNFTRLNQLSNNYTIRIMQGMGYLDPTVPFPIWYWLYPCASGFRQSQGTVLCNQPVATVNGTVEQIPVGTAYQETYMSKIDTATPKFDGRTLQRQFETIFNNSGTPIVLIVSWNEFMAQRFCLDANSNATANNCNSQNDHWPNGNKIFVDQYNKDYNRDIEPAENDKSNLYYNIAKACISLYKQGGRCDANNSANLCCNTPIFIHGYVDGYRCDNSSWNIAGWATDDRDHKQKLTVKAEVYPDNEPYNKVTFTSVASGSRPDLTGVCPEDGSCAYGIKINSLPQAFLSKKLRAHVFGVAYDGREREIEFPFANNSFGPCNNLISTPTPTPTPLPGDLNHDNKINISDYNLLLQNFGRTKAQGFLPPTIDPDIVKNDKVDIFDYNILVGNFGK